LLFFFRKGIVQAGVGKAFWAFSSVSEKALSSWKTSYLELLMEN
jgi:hypothetical protein